MKDTLIPSYSVSDFDYILPQELIAQTPIEDRQTSKLLMLDKKTGKMHHNNFYNIVDCFKKGDCLVLNNTKVIPARLYGNRQDSGGRMEFLLIKPHPDNIWEVILRPGKKAKLGSTVVFGDGLLKAKIIKRFDNGNRLVEFSYDGNFYDVLDKIGEMPLPHYITKRLEQKDRYQTVYSKVEGSCAAPTAGLHFTPGLLEEIEKKGVNICFVTLHVGIGTFRPVNVEDVLQHEMHSEWYEVSKQTADIINETKKKGNRVIAVGTTTTRTLESCADDNGIVNKSSGDTNIFIYPPYKFKVIDALITNFHLPKSTLIMLVSAFATKDFVLNAYKEAIEKKYRFFSFGDAMFIGDLTID